MTRHTLKGADGLMDKLKKMSKGMSGKLTVGWMAEANYPDGMPVAQVAYWNEFGHGGNFPSPARPFFRTMIDKESPTWAGKIANLAEATDYDGQRVLKMLGEDIEGALKQSITEFDSVPLSPTTLVLRDQFWGNPRDIRVSDVLNAQKLVASGATGATGTQAKPLVWTSNMLDSTAHKVEAL